MATDRKSMYLQIVDRPDWSLEDLLKLQAKDQALPEARHCAGPACC
ncbi:MAG TPA: hypothetical protein VF022_09150 [Rhodanobacteraceae bacterium]